MAYTTPKTDWTTADGILNSDLNRIEENIESLHDDRTGQDLKPTDAVTFATVNTGQGANELYDMDQNVKTTDNVTFSQITANSNILPTATPTESTISLTPASANYYPPKGVYMVYTQEISGDAYVAFFSDYPYSNWERLPNISVRCLITDGTNFYYKCGGTTGSINIGLMKF